MFNLEFTVGDTEIHQTAYLPAGTEVLGELEDTEFQPINWRQFLAEKFSVIPKRHFLKGTVLTESFEVVVGDAFMAVLPYLLATLKTAVVIGIWKSDGSPVGWKFESTFNAEGVETKTLVREVLTDPETGIETPVTEYPFNEAEMLETMEDIPVLDADLNVTGTVRPTVVFADSPRGWSRRVLSTV